MANVHWCLACVLGKMGLADNEVRRIARGVDGPSLELLAKKLEHIDTGVADLFKNGAPIVCELEWCPLNDCSLLPFAYGGMFFARAGLCAPIEPESELIVRILKVARPSKNKQCRKP